MGDDNSKKRAAKEVTKNDVEKWFVNSHQKKQKKNKI